MELVLIELRMIWAEPPPAKEPARQNAPALDGAVIAMRPFASGGALALYGVDEGPGSSRNLLDHPLFAFDETPASMDAKWRFAREMTPDLGEGESSMGTTWIRPNLRMQQDFRFPCRKNVFAQGWRWDQLISPQGASAAAAAGLAGLGTVLAGAAGSALIPKTRALNVDLGLLDGRDNCEPATLALERFFERELAGVPFVGPWTAVEIAKELLERQSKELQAAGSAVFLRPHPDTADYHAQILGRVRGQAERLQMLAAMTRGQGVQGHSTNGSGAAPESLEKKGSLDTVDGSAARPAAKKPASRI